MVRHDGVVKNDLILHDLLFRKAAKFTMTGALCTL